VFRLESSMRHRLLVAGAAAAALLLSSELAVAAAPIRHGWYEAPDATAIVSSHGRSAVFTFAASCVDARFKTRTPVAIRRGRLISHEGRIVSIPTRRHPTTGALRGEARITGRFVTSRRLEVTVRFKTSDCSGSLSKTLVYSAKGSPVSGTIY
jgi:hypothetical protein